MNVCAWVFPDELALEDVLVGYVLDSPRLD
jgi:hypothetical protein